MGCYNSKQNYKEYEQTWTDQYTNELYTILTPIGIYNPIIEQQDAFYDWKLTSEYQ
jgi:hypothetical protein